MSNDVTLDNVIELNNSINCLETKNAQNSDINALIKDLLVNVPGDFAERALISMPIAELSTLGAGMASLLPAFRTVTQTTEVGVQGMYQIANAMPGDILKAAKDGTSWASLKTENGASKMVKLKEAGPLTVESKSVMSINPATMMMAAALYSIECQLGNISESIDKLTFFIETEKESEIKADLKTLNSIINKYKHSWDNERFVNSNYKMVCDIQRTALKHMTSYEDRIAKLADKGKGLLVKSKVDSLLADFQKDFSHYRLSLYTFSMASFMEIMFGEKYNEDAISNMKKTLEEEALKYRKIYSQCSSMLEQLADKSIEQNLLQGIGFVGKKAGALISEIPLIKEGPVDEFLQAGGEKLDKRASRIISDTLAAFSEMSDPRIGVFTRKMDDMIQIYNHTEVICFDKEKIYLVG